MEAKNEGGVLSAVLRRYLIDNNLLVLMPSMIDIYKRKGGRKTGSTIKRLIDDTSITLKSFLFLLFKVFGVDSVKLILKIPEGEKEKVYEVELEDIEKAKIDPSLNDLKEISPEDLLEYLKKGAISWKNFIRRLANHSEMFTIAFIVDRNGHIWDYEINIRINKPKKGGKKNAGEQRIDRDKTGTNSTNENDSGSDGERRDKETTEARSRA